MSSTVARCCPLLLLTGRLLYGDLTINAPIAGYVTSPDGLELRAVNGVPGSYRFSQPISLPDGVSRIHLAPGRDFGLAERGDAELVVVVLNGTAVDRTVAAPGALAAADWVKFSPGGGSAVLYSSSVNRLQIVTGLPDLPLVSTDIDVGSLPEAPRTGAVSDDGKALLVASGAALYLVPRAAPAQLVLAGGDLGSVEFLRNRMAAVVSDNGTGSIYVLEDLDSAPGGRLLVSGLDGVRTIYPAWDSDSVFVERPGANDLSSIDLTSGDLRSAALPVPLEELIPLRNHDTFVISARAGEPWWIFLRDGRSGRAVAVPPPGVQTGPNKHRGVR